MIKEYTAFICKSCKKETIVRTEELEANKREGRYETCFFCGSKRIEKENTFDSLKECMNERSYKRKHGAIVSRER